MVLEHSVHNLPMRLIDLKQERRQAALTEVPLAYAQTDALAVEVATQTGEAFRRRLPGLERAGQRKTPPFQWCAENSRLLDRYPAEERFPGYRPDAAIDWKAIALLERLDAALSAAAENAVERTSVKPELLQSLLDLGDFRPQ